MSKLSDEVKRVILEVFPFYRLIEEHYIVYMKQKLFFDFYLPELLLAIEAQGVQHDKFVQHFHKDTMGFYKHKSRDKKKVTWAKENNINLIEIRPSDLPLNASKFFAIVYED